MEHEELADTCDMCGETKKGCIVLCRDCHHKDQAVAIKEFLKDLREKVV